MSDQDNFSLQYQYNIKQISDENKEKYQFGDNYYPQIDIFLYSEWLNKLLTVYLKTMWSPKEPPTPLPWW